MARYRRSRLLDGLAIGCVAIGVIGLTVRLTVRDGIPLAANLFYALPSAVLVLAFAVAATSLWINRRRKPALVCAAVTLLTALAWGQGVAYLGRSCQPPRDSFRVLLWNTARGVAGWPRVAERMALATPDVIGLVEAGGSSEERKTFWLDRFPGYDAYMAGGGVVILIKGRIVDHHTMPVAGNSRCAVVEAEVHGHRLRVLVLDAIVRPFSDRREVVRGVFELARAGEPMPTVVMGDFNTPADSVWFEEPRRDFKHVFESAGRGVLATWPVPLPVLAIDHIWVSRDLDVHCSRIGWTWVSDHRPIHADVSFADGG